MTPQPDAARLNLAVLASGRGSNLQAMLDAIAAGALDAQVVGVFSDRKDAPALQRARDAGIADACARSARLRDAAGVRCGDVRGTSMRSRPT